MSQAYTKGKIALYAIAIFAALFFIMDPLGVLRPQNKPVRQALSSQQLEQSTNWIKNNSSKPEQSLTRLAASKKVIVLGTSIYGAVRDEIVFINSLVPRLSNLGIDTLGLSFIKIADQEKLNTLVSKQSAVWDESKAKDILYSFILGYGWGFQEYLDLLRSIWDYNRGAVEGQELKAVALAVSVNEKAIAAREDLTNPEKMKQYFFEGLPETRMAEKIVNWTREQSGVSSRSMLAIVDQPASLGGYEDSIYTKRMAEIGFANQKRMGRQLQETIPGQVATVLFAGPMFSEGSSFPFAYAANSLLDQAWTVMPAGDRPGLPLSFELSPGSQAAALGALSSENPYYFQNVESGNPTKPNLAQLSDVLIFLAPIKELKAVSAIQNWVNADNVSRFVVAGPDAPAPDINKLNENIKGFANQVQGILNLF